MTSLPLIIAVTAAALALIALTVVIVTAKRQAQLIERQQQRLMMLTETASNVLALKGELEQLIQQPASEPSFAATEQLQQSLELSVKQQLQQQSERLESYVKQLAAEQQALADKFQQLESQDPGAKLYQQASKLVAEGASVDEVMQSCDLPRAEAELIAAMRRR